MTRVRDFQRTKVYRAEQTWRNSHSPEMLELSEIQTLCDQILKDRNRPDVKLSLGDGRGCRTATARYFPESGVAHLIFPRRFRKRAIVLHEMAHVFSPQKRHGPAFCREMLSLVKVYLSVAEARLLQAQFTEHKVLVSEAQEMHHFKRQQKHRQKEVDQRAQNQLMWALESPLTPTLQSNIFQMIDKMSPNALASCWLRIPESFRDALKLHSPGKWKKALRQAEQKFLFQHGLSAASRQLTNYTA